MTGRNQITKKKLAIYIDRYIFTLLQVSMILFLWYFRLFGFSSLFFMLQAISMHSLHDIESPFPENAISPLSANKRFTAHDSKAVQKETPCLTLIAYDRMAKTSMSVWIARAFLRKNNWKRRQPYKRHRHNFQVSKIYRYYGITIIFSVDPSRT